MKSEAGSNTMPERQSANYKPNEEEDMNRQAEKLKEEVKLMFGKSMEVLAKLEFIDILMKLGLSILFEKEIMEALDTIAASIKINNYTLEEDLYATALCFRLLRLHGHEISQDIFRGFMDGNGSFSTSKCRDIKGLIELFEASHVALEGENILEEAKGFSNGILGGAYSTLDGELAAKVAHILELPTHWRLDWFQVKWHLKLYERNKGINSTTTILCELAKLNFNMVQATHQNELKEVSRWWKNLGLVGKLNFARDRVVESFMTGLGLVSDPKQSSYRKWFAKAIALVIVIDDIYDVYGSLEELQHFTDAVDRWDSNEIQHLPEYMKIFFQALYDTINEIANEIQHEKGWNQVLPYLKNVWVDHTKALLMEAKWYKEGYIPSLQEYLSIGWITSGCLVLGVLSFFSIMNEVSDDMEHFLEKNQQIMHDPCTIVRLWNDLSTSKAEIERGDAPSAIQCYMREANVSEEIARNHITDLISKTLTKVNGLVLAPSAASMKPFVNVLANYARVAYCFYQDGDGFGVQEDLKSKIVSVLIEPMDRVIESFVTGLGLVSDPKQSSYRKWFAKAIALVIVIDDIYDVYGSLEELQHFTNAVDWLVFILLLLFFCERVDRWDSKEIQHLPEYMKIFFQALHDTINEMADEIQHEKGWNKVLPYLKKVAEVERGDAPSVIQCYIYIARSKCFRGDGSKSHYRLDK
ncbi:hypothetical protein EZV62_026739 [Acer yangbiense]|uniref:Terpene synthase metal-binding domain-containing protein n=1 Tax=Acer yangbiense TaxID=1000413 RepID=A0A5C7GSA0_9ROSI|nr:hypothetical protein EZV62_026739 [Acer yangbiense]